jgi:5-(carboxyamino)imidazole ribonucleotide synthase
MTALAAIRMGVRVRLLAPKAEGCEAPFADVTIGDWTDAGLLRDWASACDVVTVESEWAPAEIVANAVPDMPVWPSPETLHTVRHKGRQRSALHAAGLPSPGFALASSIDEAISAAGTLGWPVMLKRFEGSYDGYGNATCHSAADIEEAWPRLAGQDGLLVEAWAPFECEAAVIVARAAGADHVVYPAVRTEQRDHRLHAAEIPAGLSDDVEAEAERVALGAIEALGAVGVMAVELFVMADGAVLINEVAPRPHNTGHITIEACHTSQFENHVRAVLGWPLGDPGLRVPAAALVNVLGTQSGVPDLAGLEGALAVEGAAVHLYGKSESRPRRKMGHVTVTAPTVSEARDRAESAAGFLHL